MNLNLRIYDSILSSSIVFPRSDYIVEKIFMGQKIQLNLRKRIRIMTIVDRGKAPIARVTRKQAFR